MKKIFWILLGILLLPGLGCRKKESGQSPVDSASHPSSPPVSNTIQASPLSGIPDSSRMVSPGVKTPVEEKIPEQVVERPRPRQFQLKVPEEVPGLQLAKSGNNYTYLAQKAPAVIPQDYRIGLLQDMVDGDREARTMALQIETFLKKIMKGEIAEEMLLSENAGDLMNLLRYNIITRGHRPRDFRIGVIAVDHDEARANLRLWGETGTSEGEMYLKRSAGQWFVSDLQIDFDYGTTDGEDKFAPSRYYWDIQ